MLDFEAALAHAHAAEGTLPAPEAERIAAVCRAERYDLLGLSREGARHAQPVVALIEAMRAQPAVYAGVPAANAAFAIAQRVIDEETGPTAGGPLRP